jgi:glycosyltransferase involved in cell wall biosynthesis
MPLTVVITVPWGERLGGAEAMLLSFLCHVDRTRVDPLVVFLVDGPFEREVSALGIRTTVLPAGRLRHVGVFVRVVRSLSALLRREHPDLILNWAVKSQLYGGPAAALAGVSNRVVWWQHGIPKGHWMDRLATLLPARAVGCSSARSADAQERLRPRRKTFVVHPGIDPPVRPRESETDALRRRLGISEDRTIVGTVGRLEPGKGQDQLLRTLAALRRQGHPVHGLIVGGPGYGRSAAYESQLKHLADQLGLGSSLTFTGHVSDVVPYASLMAVFVSAGRNESFGISVLEAMALGVPVVTTDASGAAALVEADVSAVLVSTSDDDALTRAVRRLVEDADLRRRLGRGGREQVASSLTARRMCAELERCLEAVAW